MKNSFKAVIVTWFITRLNIINMHVVLNPNYNRMPK